MLSKYGFRDAVGHPLENCEEYIKMVALASSIVRCGECRFRDKDSECLHFHSYSMDENDFCSYGKRKVRDESKM